MESQQLRKTSNLFSHFSEINSHFVKMRTTCASLENLGWGKMDIMLKTYIVSGLPGNQHFGVHLIDLTGSRESAIKAGDDLPLSHKAALAWIG